MTRHRSAWSKKEPYLEQLDPGTVLEKKFVEDDGSQGELFCMDSADLLIATGQPYNLAGFATLGDFLKEPVKAALGYPFNRSWA